MPHKIQAWDKQKHRMIGQQWLLPNWDGRLEILILSGARDKNGTDICDRDIVSYGESKYLVRFNDKKLQWIITPFGPGMLYTQGEPLNSDMAKNMEVVQNLLQWEVDNEGKRE